ncbi:aromatic acid exporter family protein [Clostridium sp.]|uniref:aromatic acid exporter family protein n=1 Tax=Clostridium sp. TaxID=1506 RepID=UPI003463AFAE
MTSLRTEVKIMKISLGVLVSLILTRLLGFGNSNVAPIAVVIVMTLTQAVHASKNNVRSLIISNIFGITIGLISTVLIGNYIIATTVAVLVTLFVCYRLPWDISFISGGVATILVIYFSSSEPAFQYGRERIFLVMLGAVVGYLVNNLVFPQSYEDSIESNLVRGSEKIFGILNEFSENDYQLRMTNEDIFYIQNCIAGINHGINMLEKDMNMKINYTKKKDDLINSYREVEKLLELSYNFLYKLFYFNDSFNSFTEEDKVEFANLIKAMIESEKMVINSLRNPGDYEKINKMVGVINKEIYSYEPTVFKGGLTEYFIQLDTYNKSLSKV